MILFNTDDSWSLENQLSMSVEYCDSQHSTCVAKHILSKLHDIQVEIKMFIATVLIRNMPIQW